MQQGVVLDHKEQRMMLLESPCRCTRHNKEESHDLQEVIDALGATLILQLRNRETRFFLKGGKKAPRLRSQIVCADHKGDESLAL